MEKKFIKILKVIAIICVIVLIIELAYIVYCTFLGKEKPVYFDGINSLYQDDSGYVTVGSNNNNDNYYEKAKITKYNKKKEIVFEKLYNKGYNGAFFGVIQDGSDYIAVGNYEATKKENKDKVRSALIVKYDKDGKILFEKDFQVLGDSKFTNVVSVDDGYIVSGQSIYENMTLGNSSDGGAFLIKYSKDGEEQWMKNYGGNKSAVYNDLIIEDGFIYAVGKDATRTGIISKYDLDGNHIKTTTFSYTDTIGFSGIVRHGDYLYVATGKKVSEDADNDDIDAAIVIYDLDCNYVDDVTYQGKGIERYNRIIKDHNDYLVVIGTTATLNKKTREYTYDGIIGKYDVDSSEVDVVSYGDEREDYFTDIQLVGDEYLVVGYSSYEDGSYLSKFIRYSDSLKVLGVE